MLLDRYEQDQLLFNMNFKSPTSSAGVAYRGELVIVPGDVADAQGRRKPPHEVLKQAVFLEKDGKIALFSGMLDDVAQLPALLERYSPEFTAASSVVVYIFNIPKEMVVPVGPTKALLVPLDEGMVWNELADLVGLEKDDFKGQSAADKVQTVYAALAEHVSKAAAVTLEEAVASATGAKRVIRGAI